MWKEKAGLDEEGMPKFVKKTWGPTSVVVDEAGCGNPLELLLPLSRFGSTVGHVVWGGDQAQLSPFLVSEEARTAWKKTMFEELQKHWPTTQLNVQYRTHSDLAEAPNHAIYDDKVTAFHKTETYASGFFKRLQPSLPITFTAASKSYALTSYLNSVDVAHGTEEGEMSKYNLAEVVYIVAMIESFMSKEIKAPEIAIITGYAAQFERL